MARIARVVATGQPHHVTQRGNRRQDVFDDPTDRQVYLSLLKEYAREYGLRISAWCLMSNHVHLLAAPEPTRWPGRWAAPTAIMRAIATHGRPPAYTRGTPATTPPRRTHPEESRAWRRSNAAPSVPKSCRAPTITPCRPSVRTSRAL